MEYLQYPSETLACRGDHMGNPLKLLGDITGTVCGVQGALNCVPITPRSQRFSRSADVEFFSFEDARESFEADRMAGHNVRC